MSLPVVCKICGTKNITMWCNDCPGYWCELHWEEQHRRLEHPYPQHKPYPANPVE